MAIRARLISSVPFQAQEIQSLEPQLQSQPRLPLPVETIIDNIPQCGCCGRSWRVLNGRMKMPVCGCAIQDHCHKCGRCLLHCSHQK